MEFHPKKDFAPSSKPGAGWESWFLQELSCHLIHWQVKYSELSQSAYVRGNRTLQAVETNIQNSQVKKTLNLIRKCSYKPIVLKLERAKHREIAKVRANWPNKPKLERLRPTTLWLLQETPVQLQGELFRSHEDNVFRVWRLIWDLNKIKAYLSVSMPRVAESEKGNMHLKNTRNR